MTTEGFKRGDRGEPGEEGEKVGSSVNRWRWKSEMRRDMKSERGEAGGGVRGVSWHRCFLMGETLRVLEQKGARTSWTKSKWKIRGKKGSLGPGIAGGVVLEVRVGVLEVGYQWS